MKVWLGILAALIAGFCAGLVFVLIFDEPVKVGWHCNPKSIKFHHEWSLYETTGMVYEHMIPITQKSDSFVSLEWRKLGRMKVNGGYYQAVLDDGVTRHVEFSLLKNADKVSAELELRSWWTNQDGSTPGKDWLNDSVFYIFSEDEDVVGDGSAETPLLETFDCQKRSLPWI